MIPSHHSLVVWSKSLHEPNSRSARSSCFMSADDPSQFREKEELTGVDKNRTFVIPSVCSIVSYDCDGCSEIIGWIEPIERHLHVIWSALIKGIDTESWRGSPHQVERSRISRNTDTISSLLKVESKGIVSLQAHLIGGNREGAKNSHFPTTTLPKSLISSSHSNHRMLSLIPGKAHFSTFQSPEPPLSQASSWQNWPKPAIPPPRSSSPSRSHHHDSGSIALSTPLSHLAMKHK